MPDKLYDYADYIKLRLVINLRCSSRRIIILVGGVRQFGAKYITGRTGNRNAVMRKRL